MTGQFFSLINLQAPSDGKTHAIKWATTVAAVGAPPSEFDFSNVGQNFVSGFTPQAIYVDATDATGQLTLLESRTGFKIQVPAGNVGNFFTLAIADPIYQLLGNAGDAATVVFLDFPAFPQGAAVQNLSQPPSDVTVTNTPLPVSVPQSPTAGPYTTQRGPGIGATGNAWNAAAVAAAGVSANIDTGGLGKIAVYGNSSAATNIGVNVSADNVTFFPSTIQAALNAAGNFYLAFESGARYIQLVSSAAATITATVSAK